MIVQKFGGTSLGTTERMRKVANIVKQFHKENTHVVAVVSALSSETKAEGMFGEGEIGRVFVTCFGW